MLYRLKVLVYTIISYPLRILIRWKMLNLHKNGYILISNNCLAGILYNYSHLPYHTPTVGLFFPKSSFLDFVNEIGAANGSASRFDRIDGCDIVFDDLLGCPTLFKDGEKLIVFLHYSSADEALRAWNRRIKRIQGKKLKILLSVRDGVTSSDVQKLQKLNHNSIILGSDKFEAPSADLCFIHPCFAMKLLRSL